MTGVTQILFGDGWRLAASDTAGSEAPNPPAVPVVSAAELGKLTGTLTIKDNGWISASIYNGTERPLDEVDVKVRVIAADGTIAIDRRYRLFSMSAPAFSSSEFIANAGFTLQEGQKHEWSIIGATSK